MQSNRVQQSVIITRYFGPKGGEWSVTWEPKNLQAIAEVNRVHASAALEMAMKPATTKPVTKKPAMQAMKATKAKKPAMKPM